MSELTAIEKKILLSIRNGIFPVELDKQGHGKEEQLAGVQGLYRQGYIVVTKLKPKETGQGDDFILQEPDLQKMPDEAELTLEGERRVDRELGIDPKYLEAKGRTALLRTLLKAPVSDFSQVSVPDGIGPRRKAFLINDIVEQGLAKRDKLVEQQGHFRISKNVIQITLRGALAYVKTEAADQGLDLRKEMKSVRRQILLRIIQQPLSISPEMIKTEMPGWGKELLFAAIKPLKTAGIVQDKRETRQQGFFSVSETVLVLTEDTQAAQIAVTAQENPTRGMSGTVSGRQIAEGLMRHPEASVKVIMPTGKGGAQQSVLIL